MAKRVFAANALTGGVSGCLDDISYTNLANGNIAIVIDVATETTYFYRYSSTETGAESTPDIIVPDDNASGSGAWKLTAIRGTTLTLTNLTLTGNLSVGGTADVTGAATAASLKLGGVGGTADEFSTDGTMAGNSDTAVPTEKAVKTYVDTHVATELGDYDDEQLHENIIINGCMSVWERGTSQAAIANSVFICDMFEYHKNGAMVHTASRSTDVPSNTNLYYSIKLDCTTADTSIAAGDYCFIQYTLEGSDFKHFDGNTMRLSFWVKSAKTGTHCVSFRSGGVDAVLIKEYTVDTANTWEHKTVTVTFDDDTGGTWGYATNRGVILGWALAAGTNYHATAADDWEVGNKLGTSSQVNVCDSTANDFYLTGVQLNDHDASPITTKFPVRPFGDTLGMCLRYFQKHLFATYEYAAAGSLPATHTINFSPNMVATPTSELQTAISSTNVSSFVEWFKRFDSAGCYAVSAAAGNVLYTRPIWYTARLPSP